MKDLIDPKTAARALRVFTVLHAATLLGVFSVIASRWSENAAWLLRAELILGLISYGAALYEDRREARLRHERDLVKLSKKKGVEFTS